MIKVFIGVLYCGENDYDRCMQSIADQEGLNIDYKVISFLPKKEAHQELYALFNSVSDEYDFVAKLDADMVFSEKHSLVSLLRHFDTGVGMIAATVWDRLTNSDMQSFNIWRGGVRFQSNDNHELFTDRVPKEFKGRQVSFVDAERNVLHAHFLDEYQAFMFGVHRATKVLQVGDNYPRIENSYHQLQHIYRVYKSWLDDKDSMRRMALLGVWAVFSGEIDGYVVRKDTFKDVMRTMHGQVSDQSLVVMLPQFWLITMVKLWGEWRLLRSLLHYFFRKLGVK